MKYLAYLAAICTPIAQLPKAAQEAEFNRIAREAKAPFAIFACSMGCDDQLELASGAADADAGQPMSVDTPVRIASNTKTFVAAAVLRLHEQRRLNLDSPIATLLDPELVVVLATDGYDPDKITVRHLLSHSAGLYDHGSDPRFVDAMLATPERRWTRRQLVELMTEFADPQSAPGTRFQYSDTGYVLLGDIIERSTGTNLSAAVRALLRFDDLNLKSTWWEIMEPTPANVPPRARNHIGVRDVSQVHASFDLFGGGGLVMSARDLGTLFAALFEGRIFDDPRSLEQMTGKGSHEGGDRYRLGLFAQPLGEHEIFSHSGFWGTAVYYDPTRRRVVAAVTTQQQVFRPDIVPLALSFLGVPPEHCPEAGMPHRK